MNQKASCPLTTCQIIDEYFIENRTRVLELAAFLDRLDRSFDQAAASDDFRMKALTKALELLTNGQSDKTERIQLLLSDRTVEPKAKLDEKSASGAWNPASAKGKAL